MSKQNLTSINDAENHLDIIHFERAAESSEICDDYTIITVKQSSIKGTCVCDFSACVHASFQLKMLYHNAKKPQSLLLTLPLALEENYERCTKYCYESE
jgi:hypothetical protein